MRFISVIIMSLIISSILFLIWSCASYALHPLCLWLQDGDYSCSLQQYLQNEGVLLVWIFFVPIISLMSLPSAKKIIDFSYRILFSLENKKNIKKPVKIIMLSLLPVIWSLVCLFYVIEIYDDASLSFVLLTLILPYWILYHIFSKQINILSKAK